MHNFHDGSEIQPMPAMLSCISSRTLPRQAWGTEGTPTACPRVLSDEHNSPLRPRRIRDGAVRAGLAHGTYSTQLVSRAGDIAGSFHNPTAISPSPCGMH